MRNGTADVSKTISHRKMLHYWLFIDITVNNYSLPRSLKGAVHLLMPGSHRFSGPEKFRLPGRKTANSGPENGKPVGTGNLRSSGRPANRHFPDRKKS